MEITINQTGTMSSDRPGLQPVPHQTGNEIVLLCLVIDLGVQNEKETT